MRGQSDLNGELIDDRIYNQKDSSTARWSSTSGLELRRNHYRLPQRTNPMDKTIVFCEDIPHAERMRRAPINPNPEMVKRNDKYA